MRDLVQTCGHLAHLPTHAANATAIRLYESIGFRHRADFVFTMVALAE